MALAFSPQAETVITELLATHLTRQSCVIPVLTLAQREFGFLTPEVRDLVAERLEIGRQHVEGVFTFYTMFHKHRPGRHHLAVCGTLSCALANAENMLRYLEKRLGIRAGETTADGRFSLERVECLGSCGTAPVLMVDDRYHEGMTPAKVDALLKELA